MRDNQLFARVMWGRESKSDDPVEGLREERKGLALRYTIDAAEALRREELTADVAREQIAAGEAAGPASADSALRRDQEATRYVIELRATGFLWRWAIFDLSVGDDGSVPPLALRSLHAVTVGALPRFSERSAKRAAEHAAREAYAFERVRG